MNSHDNRHDDEEWIPIQDDTFRSSLGSAKPDSTRTQFIAQSRRDFEAALARQRVVVLPHDADIAKRLKRFTLNQVGSMIIRFAFFSRFEKVVNGGKQEKVEVFSLTGFIFLEGIFKTKELDADAVVKLAKDLATQRQDQVKNREMPPPTYEQAKRLHALLFAPLFELFEINARDLQRLFVVPSGLLFELPLHVAWLPDDDLPLMAVVPLAFCFSATALVTRNRAVNATVSVNSTDDLCVLGCDAGGRVSEAAEIPWHSDRFHFAGDFNLRATIESRLRSTANDMNRYRDQLPSWINFGSLSEIEMGVGDRESLKRIMEQGPEFFLFHGHGLIDPLEKEAGPVLQLEKHQYATQYDLAKSRWLIDNKLSILAACVTGKEVSSTGGEVSGMLRALSTAGASALAVSLWQILNFRTRKFVSQLFQQLIINHQRADLMKILQGIARSNAGKVDDWKIDKTERYNEIVESCVFQLYV